MKNSLGLIETLKSIFGKAIVRIFLALTLLTVIAAVSVLHFEGIRNPGEYRGLWDSVWWALVTVFTVGYGDIRPITIGGRIVGIFVMISGVTLVSLITATISSIFVAKKIREDQGLESINYEDHIIICGWNNRAESIIETFYTLAKQKAPKIILVNELPEDEINTVLDRFRKNKVKFIRGDYTRNAPLERANIKVAKTIILLPNLHQFDPLVADEKTLLATLNIKSTYPKKKVIAFIMTPENEIHVKRAKADEVFVSDQYVDFLLAGDIIEPGLSNVVSKLFSAKSEHRISTVNIPSRLKGKSFLELTQFYKNQHRMMVLGVVSEVESIGVSDFLSSDSSHLDAFIERKIKEAGKTLGEENKVIVNLNPADEYIIQENEKAIVLL
ncbi:MAG: potassium channel family protein [Candidatus Marinimicrobia bacterium]|nr:potassium channel family protein [bacterium]MCG2716947.1 potassium channel family protein [Candidatus Neomarinimicrobiota bacterium]